MEDISFLRKKLSWKRNSIYEYQTFSLSQLNTIKHFVENNKEYFYLIELDTIIVMKKCKTII